MYRMSWLTIAIFKRTLTVDHYSMPNHLTDPPAVPELVQEAANADRLLLEVEKLLDDKAYFASMQSALTDIAPMLSLDSGVLACEAIEELLAEQSAR